MTKHFFFMSPYSTFDELIIGIIYNMTKFHLIFDDMNKLEKIMKMNAPNDEIAMMTVGKTYEFINGKPMPFHNYAFEHATMNNIVYSIILNDESLNTLIGIEEILDTIENFEEPAPDVYDRVIEEFKINTMNDTVKWKSNNIKKIQWVIFENFLNQFKLLQFENKNNESYVEILDNGANFIKEYISNVINKICNEYKDLCNGL